MALMLQSSRSRFLMHQMGLKTLDLAFRCMKSFFSFKVVNGSAVPGFIFGVLMYDLILG